VRFGTINRKAYCGHSITTALANAHLQIASAANSGRSALTVFGRRDHVLRQTLIALIGGQFLAEHESPGDFTPIPTVRHRLEAISDAALCC